MSPRTLAVMLAGSLALAAGPAEAAEQTILGQGFQVKDPKPGVDATKRKFRSEAKEKDSPNTLVGDPTQPGSAGGAILEVFAFGANPSSQTFVLPQGTSSKGKPFWTTSGGNGFKYTDKRGEQGPVVSVKMKLSPGAQFTFKVTIRGKNGPLNVVPPNPGTSGCVALKLGIAGAGDRYSIQFGPESQITNKGNTFFKAKKPQVEGVCPGGGPTTSTTTTTMATTTTTSTSSTTSTTAAPTTTTTTSTTTTTLYGSPSRAFLTRAPDLLD